jgi:hypothetical protein
VLSLSAAAVHAHLIGRLALVEQRLLTDRLRPGASASARESEDAAEWSEVPGGLGCLGEIQKELRALLSLESSKVLVDDVEKNVWLRKPMQLKRGGDYIIMLVYVRIFVSNCL